ncbi:MAG TPA: hypothetical protein VGI27_00925, partial [Solirubrobacteraceae bacterium]
HIDDLSQSSPRSLTASSRELVRWHEVLYDRPHLAHLSACGPGIGWQIDYPPSAKRATMGVELRHEPDALAGNVHAVVAPPHEGGDPPRQVCVGRGQIHPTRPVLSAT